VTPHPSASAASLPHRSALAPLSPGRRPKVGLQLPEVERVVRWPELRSMARLAEAVGFDSLWYGDHLLYRDPELGSRGPWEAWSILAALAAVTEKIALGPLVACTAFHQPAILAKKAATVDEISGGRLILGLGAGWNEVEFRAFGLPFDHRVARFEEAFTIIRRLLREGRCDFRGQYYTVEEAELQPPPRPGGPPLLIGSTGTRMLAATLPHVDAWNIWYADYGNDPDGLAPFLERLDSLCRAVGRDPATLERTCAVLVGLPGGQGRPSGDPATRAVSPIRGDPAELAEVFRRFATLGIDHLQLVLDPIEEASIEALAPVLELLQA